MASQRSLSAQTPVAAAPQLVQKADAKTGRYWTTRWEFENVDIDKLAGRLKSIGIDLGLQLRGTATVKLDVGIPLTSLRDGAAYRFDGTLTSPGLVIDDVELKDFETSVSYRNGLATLTRLKSSVVAPDRKSSGTVQGGGSLQLVPRGDATADLKINNIALSPISDLIAKFLPSQNDLLPDAGRLSGDIRFRAPIDRISEMESYELAGKVNGQGLKLASLPPADVKIDNLTMEDGRLKFSGFDLIASSSNVGQSDIRLIGRGDVPLGGEGAFSFELAGDDLPLGAIARLSSRSTQRTTPAVVDGKLDFRVRGAGVLAPEMEASTWKIDGSVASPSLQVAGVDLGVLEHTLRFTPNQFDVLPRRDEATLPPSFTLVKIRSKYSITSESLTLQSLSATAFGGQISGTATLPRQGQGDLVAVLSFADIRPNVRIPVFGKVSPIATATIAGNIDWRVPIDKLLEPNQHVGKATLSVAEIRINEERVGELVAELVANQGELALQASGDLLGGSVEVQTVANVLATDRWSDVMSRLGQSTFRFEHLSITPLVDLSVGRRVGLTGDASGHVVVDFDLQPKAQSNLQAKVFVELSRVHYRSRLLSRKLSLNGRLEKGVFVVQPLLGDYANGSLRLDGRVDLFDRDEAFYPRADLRLVASRIQMDRGLWFLGNKAERIQGRVSTKVTIAGHQESVRIRGSLHGRELVAYDLPIGVARGALTASANLKSWRWDVSIPSVRSSVGGGQLDGELHLSSGRRGGFDMTSRWKTRRVDVFRLTHPFGRSSSLASGEITGEMSLGGKSVRSVDDLAGRFDFQLGRTRSAAIPGLIAASQFLGPVSLAGQTFDVGEAKGLIGQGVVVIDEFWLGSDNALVRADGKLYLRSGRLDMIALIATGDYRDIAANLGQLAQKYALRSLLPASAIFSVTELFRDRTVVLAVLGTTQNPIVRLRPVETFREEAARFLLREGQRLVLAGTSLSVLNGLDGGS
ncbi:AsmA-like C-terminal region-containing protein [Stieleria neptunia]|nr:AsmA-like C-terminal region-containing protein [Stieleria neptunia]